MGRGSQRSFLILMAALFVALVGLSFWHTSLDFGSFRPDGALETYLLWAILTFVALGVFALGFLLFRNLLKLYIERRQDQLGSKIKTKLVAGALLLSIVPVVSMVIFSFTVVSRTFDKWFSYHTREVLVNSEGLVQEVTRLMKEETADDAIRLANAPETLEAFDPEADRDAVEARLQAEAERLDAQYVAVIPAGSTSPALELHPGDVVEGPVDWRRLLQSADSEGIQTDLAHDQFTAAAPVIRDGEELGKVVVAWHIPESIRARQEVIQQRYQEYLTLEGGRAEIKYSYLALLALITVFVLFVAVWLSLFLSKQISTPIEALVQATTAVSSGELSYRVRTRAIDELGGLVRSFNDMTGQLEQQTRELRESNQELERANDEIESRRRFINAILESITPGVLSVNASGEILKANSSVRKIFEAETDAPAGRIDDLFNGQDLSDVRYMLNRAQRTGFCTREFEIKQSERIRHLSISISLLETAAAPDRLSSRYVVVIEDATDLLLAQKAAAWNEVARRIAHEIKNPLTPIALSAERMDRLLDRLEQSNDPAERHDLRQRFERSTQTILSEVETLRRLVDEFAQFARFPKSKPSRCDLNEIVEQAATVFEGRLDGMKLAVRTEDGLSPVMIDAEHFKRVVINLIDNAAEAIQDCWVREILVTTRRGPLPDTVELAVSDTGPGISPEDKERLFLPYFSTKDRGTGLGLAIVNRIIAEHGASIRVEDNRPSGTRFLIEIPTADTPADVLVESTA